MSCRNHEVPCHVTTHTTYLIHPSESYFQYFLWKLYLKHLSPSKKAFNVASWNKWHQVFNTYCKNIQHCWMKPNFKNWQPSNTPFDPVISNNVANPPKPFVQMTERTYYFMLTLRHTILQPFSFSKILETKENLFWVASSHLQKVKQFLYITWDFQEDEATIYQDS
jgi:hypothetical protein